MVYPRSGHPSVAVQVQERVSSPAKDRRSVNCAAQPNELTRKPNLTRVSSLEINAIRLKLYTKCWMA